MASQAARRVVAVYGGAGALGRSVVSRFQRAGWTAVSLDVRANPDACRSETLAHPPAEMRRALEGVAQRLGADGGLRAVVCAAGGWEGGEIGDESTLDALESVLATSVRPSFAAAFLAARAMQPGGLLVLTGAAPAHEGGTPGMAAYGAAKAAVHHLVASAAAGGLPDDATAVGILPTTLDTEGNRAAMPDADRSAWTPPDDVADHIFGWTERTPPPVSGGLYRFDTSGGRTYVQMVNEVGYATK